MSGVSALGEPRQTPRVLMAHWDGGGNVPPQRALARELVRRGCEVHVVTHAGLAQKVIADGARYHPLAGAKPFDPLARRRSDEELRLLIENVWSAEAFADDVARLHAQLSPDICVVDAMLVSTLHRLVHDDRKTVVLHHLAWPSDGACPGLLDILIRRVAADPKASFTKLAARATRLVCTTYPAFSSGADALPSPHFVGPIREPVEESSWPRSFADRPLILVGFSTMFQEQDATLPAICEALATLPVEVVITTGPAIDPAELTSAPNLRIEVSVSHDRVLPHADLTITHGGLGTTMFSAGAGVPMLVFPNGRDQVDNAAAVCRLGLGRSVSRDASIAEIRDQTLSALGDRALRAACRNFAVRHARFGDLDRAASLVAEAAA